MQRLVRTMEEEFNVEENIYLSLCSTPIRFEPVSKITNVFYDDANQQVFAVRSGGATGVVVKGQQEHLNCTFRMEDKGPVQSIKFSPDQNILAVQRSNHSVEFVNFSQHRSENFQEYSQTCKGKNGIILGFIWIAPNEILFITNVALELFQVYPEKRMLKFLKSVSIAVDWFQHSPESSTVVVSSGGILQPFQHSPENLYKYPKLDIDLASAPKNQSTGRQSFPERDVSIVTLYNQTAVLILRHKPKTSTGSGAEVDVYILNKEGSTTKSHVLKLDTSGRFAINVIDNLIVVHHQASKTSMLFDVRLSCGSDGSSTYHQQLVVGMPIKPFRLQLPMVPSPPGQETVDIECELYSSNWVVFHPNVIIDAKLGCVWNLELTLDPLRSLTPDKVRLVEFFLQRVQGKKHLLRVLKESILKPTFTSYSVVARIFDIINENYRSFLNVELQNQMALPTSGRLEPLRPKGIVLLDQQDLYTNIFSNFQNTEAEGVTDQYTIFVVTEYIRSLAQFQIPVNHYIYELVINAMVRRKSFYQLHQFLMCHVVTDSKPLACLLLSLEGVYPAALQLALDMLRRLSTANDLIVEVLLNKQKVIQALRFVQSYGKSDSIQARKFLDAAMRAGDRDIFYALFKFFEERNYRLKGTFDYDPNEMCSTYVEYFKSVFGTTSACNRSGYSEP